MTKEKSVEEKILDAARTVFYSKGFDGAKMQEIADLAQINKALLHYYFRSKEKLFEAIIHEAIGKMIPRVHAIFDASIKLEEKIVALIDTYIELLKQNPLLPVFILQEINRNPQRIKDFLYNSGLNPSILLDKIQADMKQRKIIHISAQQLIINIISLCVFPFAAKPLFIPLIFEGNEETFDKFMTERRENVKLFILNAIEIKKSHHK